MQQRVMLPQLITCRLPEKKKHSVVQARPAPGRQALWCAPYNLPSPTGAENQSPPTGPESRMNHLERDGQGQLGFDFSKDTRAAIMQQQVWRGCSHRRRQTHGYTRGETGRLAAVAAAAPAASAVAASVLSRGSLPVPPAALLRAICAPRRVLSSWGSRAAIELCLCALAAMLRSQIVIKRGTKSKQKAQTGLAGLPAHPLGRRRRHGGSPSLSAIRACSVWSLTVLTNRHYDLEVQTYFKSRGKEFESDEGVQCAEPKQDESETDGIDSRNTPMIVHTLSLSSC